MAQEPLILAVETSSRIGSVAIASGEKMLAEATFSSVMRHSSELFPAIQKLLGRFARKPQEIEHVYVSIGPGSFTGLRIAVTLAKTIHLANPPRRTKTVAVDTLDVITANATDYINQKRAATGGHPELIEESLERVAPVLDAKRNQFFVAVYQRTAGETREMDDPIWKKILPDSLMTASQFIEKFAAGDKPVWLLGDGLLYYRDKFKAEGVRFLDQKYWSPRASKVHLLGWQKALAGQFADPMTLVPNYLRRCDFKIGPP